MLECLSAPIATDAKDAVIPSGCYDLELQDQCNKPRWQYVVDHLGITTGIKRPVANIPQQLLDWAQEQKTHEKMVLLFPQTHWKPREWPYNLWGFLALQLKENGYKPIFMVDHSGKDLFANLPVMRYWGFSLGHVMAMMMVADVVIGNDSGPAHMAGTLDRPTIALMGPTKPNVFAHCPSVQCLQAKTQPCVGCHFARPFSAPCDSGCSALFAISPQTVIDAVDLTLNTSTLRIAE